MMKNRVIAPTRRRRFRNAGAPHIHRQNAGALRWLVRLFEEDDGKPSLRRVSFGYALALLTWILVVQVWRPHVLTDFTVGAIRELFIAVCVVYGLPRAAESITDTVISTIQKVRGE
jgi:hypothetical protein